MTGKTKVWPVKSTISPDIVRWPAVISSPEHHYKFSRKAKCCVWVHSTSFAYFFYLWHRLSRFWPWFSQKQSRKLALDNAILVLSKITNKITKTERISIIVLSMEAEYKCTTWKCISILIHQGDQFIYSICEDTLIKVNLIECVT